MTSLPKRIAIIGTGLIGGSLGRAIKTRLSEVEIVGVDEAEILDEAIRLGAIDVPAANARDAVSAADLVFIATPLSSIPGVLRELAGSLRAGTVVTDVGSVKSPVVHYAKEVLPKNVHFIGGHPMAGSASGGIEQSDPLLFENAVYVLTSDDETLPQEALSLAELITAIGGRVLVMSAEKHDRVAAAVSHLPQLLAVLLVEAAYDVGGDDALVTTLAAGGFRDMTRIADSPFRTWEGILAANHGNVLDALATFAAGLQKLRNRLIEEDYPEVNHVFDRARTCRSDIPTDMRGFLSPLHRISVGLEDRKGALHEVTGVLAEAGISIKDIELLKIREGASGSFRIGFASAEDAQVAAVTLGKAGFQARSVA
jgi:prephenate dehydrogenase